MELRLDTYDVLSTMERWKFIYSTDKYFVLFQSMIGHGLGAAGGLEAIATIKAITTGWLHPTINQDVMYHSPQKGYIIFYIASHVNVLLLFFWQNLEPDVTIDTVPNVKKKHEVNVGMCFCSRLHICYFSLWKY